MPDGKPAGARCVQLTDDNRCLLFGRPERPEVCVRLRPSREMCGETTEEALAYLVSLSRDRKRAIGLVALAIGVALVWLSGRAG